MPIYGWKREKWSDAGNWHGLYEYAETDSPDTPPVEDEGWVRHYVYSVGKVSNAGGSPSRQVGR